MTLTTKLIGNDLAKLVKQIPSAKLVAIKEVTKQDSLPKALDELKSTKPMREDCLIVIIKY